MFSTCLALLVSLAGIVFAFVFIYWKRLNQSHYWKSKGVPCDDPIPFIGNLLGFLRGKTLFEEDQRWLRKYGKVFGSYTGTTPALYVADPEILRKILVKDFHVFTNRRHIPSSNEIVNSFVSNLKGDEWKRVRSVITPAFSTGKLKKMIPLITECSEYTIENLRTYAESESTVDCKRIFAGFSLDVIASTAFGTKLNSHADPDNMFVQNAKKLFAVDFNWRLILYFLFPKLAKVNLFFDEVTEFFSSLTQSIVDRRRKTKEVRDDLLNNMMEAQKNCLDTASGTSAPNEIDALHKPVNKDDENLDDDENQACFKNYKKNKSISEVELVAQSVLFFLAGSDTTATTLSFVAYHLSQYPEHQAKLIEEVDSIWEKYGKIDAEGLSAMKFADAVISETMRLSPPAYRIERTADEDYPIGDTGIILEKGMTVCAPIYGMHRDPEFFPDPLTFKPERFFPENKDQINPYTYMPFGSGPRNCIGMRLALNEVKIGLLQVYKHFRFEVCPETMIPMKYMRGSGVLQPKEVKLKIIKRRK